MNFLFSLFFSFNIIFLATAGMVQAQSCDCNENLSEYIKKFEMSYAGFQFKTSENKLAYLFLKDNLLKQSSESKNMYECYILFKKYADFFYDKHIILGLTYDSAHINEIKNIFSKFKSTYPNIKSLAAAWDKQKKDSIEGYWEDKQQLKYYIKKEGAGLYVGYMIDGDGIFWHPGQKKLQLQKQKNYYKIIVFSNERTKILTNTTITKSHIRASLWDELYRNDHTIELPQQIFYQAISTDTGWFSVQSFRGNNYYIIDSIITANLWHIKKARHLYIDLRNNPGGGFATVEKILPYLLTKPAPYVFYALSNPSSIKNIKRYLTETSKYDPALLTEWKKQSDWMEKHPGEFYEEKYFENLPDTISPYPEKVHVFINENSCSAAEMFAKYLKDNSSKVILYGRNTGGYIDYGNTINAELPCRMLYCYIPDGHSAWVPKQAYDRRGLPPDVYIPYEITDWIKYIGELNKKKRSKTLNR
jgi:hypothetical protein